MQYSFLRFIHEFFKALLLGGDAGPDAAQCRKMLREGAAVLEREKSVSGASGALREVFSGLSRLFLLCANLSDERVEAGKSVVLAAHGYVQRVREGWLAGGGASEIAALVAEGKDLVARFAAFAEDAPEAAPVAQGRVKLGLRVRERLAMGEIRDMAGELAKRQVAAPASMQGALERVREGASSVLALCEARGGPVLRECKFLKKYLSATLRVVEGLAALEDGCKGRDTEMMTRSAEVLERIANAFAAEETALRERNREGVAADLSVLDALLRMDGK